MNNWNWRGIRNFALMCVVMFVIILVLGKAHNESWPPQPDFTVGGFRVESFTTIEGVRCVMVIAPSPDLACDW